MAVMRKKGQIYKYMIGNNSTTKDNAEKDWLKNTVF